MSQNQATEEWRPVVGFAGLYEVSNLGRVRSLDRTIGGPRPHVRKGRILRPAANVSGHDMVMLGRGIARTVRTIVAEAFLGPRQPGYVVRNKNGLLSDNRATNLLWEMRGAACDGDCKPEAKRRLLQAALDAERRKA